MRPPVASVRQVLPPPSSGAAFSFAGPGFHTGVANRLSLRPGTDGVGRLRRDGIEEVVWGPGSRPEAVGRCTSSAGAGPLEHLSAAALANGVSGWVLEVDHGDLPIFDGSAAVWDEAFAHEAFPRRSELTESVLPVSGRWVSGRGGVLEAEPSDRFRMRVEWTRGPCGIEVWEGGAQDLAGILGARTFATAMEYAGALQAGLLKGTGPGSGRLLRGDDLPRTALELARELGVDPSERVWSGGPERVPGECAAHKAIDLAGDIGVWIGYLPPLSVFARDAGHELHHRLGRALRDALEA